MALYVVTHGGKERLIEAKTRAGARSYAAKDSIKVERADPGKAHELAVAGVKIETAVETEE